MMKGNSRGSPSGFASMPSGRPNGAKGNRPGTRHMIPQPAGAPCPRCGGTHDQNDCKWLTERKECSKCNKVGHAPSHCRSPALDSSLSCKCCGEAGHVKRDCDFKNDPCVRCNVRGHTQAICHHPVGYVPVHRPRQQQQGNQNNLTPAPTPGTSKHRMSHRTFSLRTGYALRVANLFATQKTRP